MNPSSEASAHPFDILERQTAALKIADEQDLLLFLPFAARLYALNREDQYKRWPALATQLKVDLSELLRQRAEEGIWSLQNAVADHLALAVISAQDFYCFLRIEQGWPAKRAAQTQLFDSESIGYLAAWAQEAEATPLDSEAVSTLEEFGARYPLPLELQLQTVAAPMTLEHHALLAELRGQAKSTIELPWPQFEGVPEKEVLYLDGGPPGERTIRRFRLLDVELDCGQAGAVAISRQLLENWSAHYSIQSKVPARSLRLGNITAIKSGDNTFEVPTAQLKLDDRFEFLWAPNLICFEDGTRVRLRNPK